MAFWRRLWSSCWSSWRTRSLRWGGGARREEGSETGWEPGAWEDRASRSSARSIATCKAELGHLAPGRPKFSSHPAGPGTRRKWEIPRVPGPAWVWPFPLPTSARSSRLRSTIASPRILFTSGRSGSGIRSSTISHSDGESRGSASPRRGPPLRPTRDSRPRRGYLPGDLRNPGQGRARLHGPPPLLPGPHGWNYSARRRRSRSR